MEAELVNNPNPVGGPSRVKGLPDSIDKKNLRATIEMLCGGRIGRNGRMRTIKNIKASLNKEHSKLLDQRKGAKVLDTTTCADYKVTNGVFAQDPTMCLRQPIGRRSS
jgi:hypothetical protein